MEEEPPVLAPKLPKRPPLKRLPAEPVPEPWKAMLPLPLPEPAELKVLVMLEEPSAPEPELSPVPVDPMSMPRLPPPEPLMEPAVED